MHLKFYAPTLFKISRLSRDQFPVNFSFNRSSRTDSGVSCMPRVACFSFIVAFSFSASAFVDISHAIQTRDRVSNAFQNGQRSSVANGKAGKKKVIGSVARQANKPHVTRAKLVTSANPELRIRYNLQIGENASYLREGDDKHAYVVLAVIDSTTVMLRHDGHPRMVRLLGLDQTIENDRQNIKKLEKLLLGQLVFIDFDDSLAQRDSDGTMVVYMFRFKDKLFVNQEMIQSGHALAAQNYPYTFSRLFTWAQKKSQDAKNGFWGEN